MKFRYSLSVDFIQPRAPVSDETKSHFVSQKISESRAGIIVGRSPTSFYEALEMTAKNRKEKQ